jgi:23S rRNA (pseudouridine1915-N3)-methyltransferase
VGRDRSGLFEPAVADYAKRLSHYCRFELVELPESRRPVRAVDEEGAALLRRVGGDLLVALDERGRTLDSRGLAEWLGALASSGRDAAFCIGSADGLAEAVRRKAALVLSLSAMTLPHRLARLVLVEQLYRAFTILRHEPYHR